MLNSNQAQRNSVMAFLELLRRWHRYPSFYLDQKGHCDDPFSCFMSVTDDADFELPYNHKSVKLLAG